MLQRKRRVAAYCVSVNFSDDNHPFNALLIMLAFWAAQIVMWFKNTIVGTAAYYLYAKRQWIDEVEEAFETHRFPIYPDRYPDAEEYLSKVQRGKRSTLEQITWAAATLGQLQLARIVKPTLALKTMAVIEAALQSYRRRVRQDRDRRRAEIDPSGVLA